MMIHVQNISSPYPVQPFAQVHTSGAVQLPLLAQR
jgi:hypothetical protein